MHVTNSFYIGLLSASVGVGFLLGVLILPRIHRHVTNDFVFMAILTAGDAVTAGLFMLIPECPSNHSLCFELLLRRRHLADLLGGFDEAPAWHSGGLGPRDDQHDRPARRLHWPIYLRLVGEINRHQPLGFRRHSGHLADRPCPHSVLARATNSASRVAGASARGGKCRLAVLWRTGGAKSRAPPRKASKGTEHEHFRPPEASARPESAGDGRRGWDRRRDRQGV